ncbi:glycophorin A domain-containing protein [Purpureocillium lilacinum]|uniref:Glycophorin A domain-containing protein n=1 Tax=Purpureocillium lilacinum TaxID=33203 RepID=A0A179HMV6_PURLI|nr:glycophorin A domain-containing protein [Purpureocillium lilacinum]KAK4086259.1 hypothetical protein Purlil1_9344 [Purpureocillium lilacinum]OAQ91745.1 glycophorin A domain-containing protein [Purpureocillium lilacinum]
MRPPIAAAGIVAALAAGLASASPLPNPLDAAAGLSFLFQRAACNACGADGQLCCTGDQVCTTLANNIATCLAGGGGGGYGQYTTTWTETRTFTSTIMTHWAPAPEPTAGVDCVPQAPEQQACGSICCAGWQTCAFKGQCSLRPGYQEPSTVVVTASDGKLTTRYSAPFRVTGTTTITSNGPNTNSATATPTGTATSSSSTATSTSDGDAIGADGGTTNHGLSGGAIAGIVIGTLVGVALLLLLCFCCIARGLWNAIFGRKRHHDEKRERVDVYEERVSRHGSRQPSAYSRRERHGGWFGGGGGPSSAGGRREKKKSDGGWWLGLAGAAATILALLNLKKDKKKPPRKPMSSRYSDSYYSYTDATSASSSSSGGRRTQYTRRSAGGSRPPPPRSHYSRSSRRP